MLQAGDRASLDVAATGRVIELGDEARLDAGVRIVLGEHRLGVLHLFLQSAVPCQADHIAHARALAPAQQPLAAEARVPAHDDVNARPRPAQQISSSEITAAQCSAPSMRLRRRSQAGIACPQITFNGRWAPNSAPVPRPAAAWLLLAGLAALAVRRRQ